MTEKEKDNSALSFQEYFENVLIKASSAYYESNRTCFEDLELEGKAEEIDNQVKRTSLKLVKDYRKYYGNNLLKELKAIAETLFETSYLMYLLENNSKLDEEDIKEIDKLVNQDQLDLVCLDNATFMQTFMTHFDLDVIIQATDRVIANIKDSNNVELKSNSLNLKDLVKIQVSRFSKEVEDHEPE